MSGQPVRFRQPVVVVLGHVDSGKCVVGKTLLELGDGRILSAESVFETCRDGEPTLTPDGEVYKTRNLSLLSASENGRVSPRRVSHVWKLKSNRLVRVRTRAGHEIETTPEHKFLTFTSGRELRYVEAENLRLGDHLLVPRRIEVRPWSLSEVRSHILKSISDDFLLKVDDGLNKRLEVFCRGKGVYRLGLEIGDKSLAFHIGHRYYRASVLRELARRAGVGHLQLYEGIERFKYSTKKRRASHRSFWLPLPKTAEQFSALYYTVGLLYGDGLRKSAYLANTSHFLIKEFQDCLRTAFGVGVNVHWRRTSFIISHRGGLTFSKLLVQLFGYPETDKTRILAAPPIICCSSNQLVARFLQGFFDAEGWVEKRNNFGVSCESPVLMRQLPMLLHRFGCLSYFAKKRKRLELMISGSSNTRCFIESIGFRDPAKAQEARKAARVAVSSRIFDKTPVEGSFVKNFRQQWGIRGSRDFQLHYYETRANLTTHALSRLLSLGPEYEEGILAEVLTNYRMVQVSAVQEMEGDFTVYDFTVGETHNFIANNMIVHNTSLLDKIRGTAVQAREAGGITQQIGASYFPLETLETICGSLLNKAGGELQVPGLLVIDTPGHEIFSNLRLRGGSAADIAILVVDVMKGLENQTLESIDILKQRKVPFIIALNKIDMIKGWRKGAKGQLSQVMKELPPEWNDELEERLYNVVGGLGRLGFQSDAYFRVKDFRQQVSIVPVSARFGVGIPELLAMLIGLAQQFLKGKLSAIGESPSGRGIILEMQEEVGIGQTANVILTEGKLAVGDSIVLVRRDGPIRSKIKALFMPKPLDEMRDPRDKFTPVDSVFAAAGVKLVSSDLPGVVSGTSVASFKTDAQFDTLAAEMERELKSIVVKTENMGVVVKAGNVGGLEALLRMLEERGIPVREADIGDISRNDIVEAGVVRDHDPYLAAVLAFNVKMLQDARDSAAETPVFLSAVIYEVINNYVNWAAKKREEDERSALSNITLPCKLKVLPGSFFRNRDPAVFGVEIMAGRLKPKVRLMGSDGQELGTIEQIQDKGKNLAEVKTGDKVAISVHGPTLGRQIKENDLLYTLPRSHDVKVLKQKHLAALSQDDLVALDEIVQIKTATDPLFGF